MTKATAINQLLRNDSDHFLRMAYKPKDATKETILTLRPKCDIGKDGIDAPNEVVVSQGTYDSIMSLGANKTFLNPSISGKTVLSASPTTAAPTHV